MMESLRFIKTDAEYRDALRRLAALRRAGAPDSRDDVKRLAGLINLYENPSSREERKRRSETIQRLIDEGALKGVENEKKV